jgi:hypothetical protein
MGAQQVLRATVCVAALAATASADPRGFRSQTHEKVAVIDLGPPDDGATRRKLQAAIVAAGLEPVIGDGVEDALAGELTDPDAVELAAAIDQAQRAFGALQCSDATSAAKKAIEIGAARQAAGRKTPELPRAWAYVLLCADRAGNFDAAMQASRSLAALGGAPDLVDANVLAKYPPIDAVSNRDVVDVDISAGDGATIWIDHARAGASPLHVVLPAGEHLIAAAAGDKRGATTVTLAPHAAPITLGLAEQAAPWAKLAQRVAGWSGKAQPASELAWVLGQVHARIALIRRGDTVEAWGQAGRAEAPHRLGGDDGTRKLAETDQLMALVIDRVHTWSDHAPDPDKPLMVESMEDRKRRDGGKQEEPTKWWVYATVLGALAAGATIVYMHDSAGNSQRVELHYP